MKKGLVRFVFSAVLLLSAGAMLHAQDVTYNSMPGVNFSTFHTYKWVEIEGGNYPDQIVDAQIKQAIDAQLAAKGFTKVTSDPADMYVGYQTTVTQSKEWNAYGMGGGLRWGGMASATQSTINTGTLGLDFYNPATKQLIWRGQATKTLNPSKNQQKNISNLNKAMAKLLKNFPPPTN
jgi:hypothetical protein